MESSNGSGNSDIKSHHHHLEKKRLNRAPSPARPLLKDVHSRSPKQSAIVPKSPKLIKQQPSSVSLATQSRVSRRTVTGSKEKSAPAKSNTKSSLTKKAVKATQHAATEQKIASKVVDSSPHLIKSKKGRLAPLSQGPLGHGSPIRVPTGATLGRVSQTDSSSDLSDCPSEPLSDEQRLAQAASSDAESGTGSGSSDRDQVAADNPLQPASSTEAGGGAAARLRSTDAGAAALAAPGGRGAMSQATPVPGQPSTGALTVKCKPEKPATSAQSKGEPGKDFAEEDLLREIEDLRSENDYLKDEVEELRAEMEELRDSYLEEEVYQLQELRRELDRSNKNCRILQYRLRKAEQRSLRVAQTGHVDGELLRSLEQDLKVAKDVSVRLHNELESVEDKRTRAEDENELLRQRVIEIEISKQALNNELDRVKETALRRRGSRETFKDKKSLTQEDSADLRCQLQFAKEESALMRKKMAKLGREKDELEQELQKYKSVYGDVDSPLPVAELTGGGPHSTREAELRLRLKLVEEEANILGRKIVELEVENRGLRAENEDLRCQYERDCLGREPFSSVPTSPYGGDALESAGELRRHLQFVEEEAELLRRSISEIEDHNKQLTTELNRFKFGPSTGDGEEGVEAGGGGASKPGNGGGSGLGGGNGSGLGANSGGGLLQEELKAARLQINELSGKVMKLQYENRVLISNMQRCDLAAHLGTRSASPPDAETELRRREGEDEDAGPMLLLHPKREGPVGGESDSEDLFERTATSGFGSSGKPSSDMGELVELAHRRKEDQETLSNVKREAERLGKTVERLISDTDSLIFEGRLVVTGAEALSENTGGVGRADGDSPDAKPDSQVLDSISSRMKAFRTELHIFMEKVDHLGEGLRDRGDDLSPMPHLTESSSFLSTVTSMSRDSPIGTLGRDLVTDFQSGRRDEPEWALGQQRGVVEVQGPGAPLGPSALRGTAGPTRYSRSQSLRAEIRDLSVPDVSTPARELQFRLEHERRLRVGQDEREGMPASITQEARRGLELQGLQPHEPAWPQERALLQQEVRLFRHNTVILYMKLRWILMHWRLGRRAEATEEGAHAEYERLENIPEMGVAMEPGEEGTDRGDRLFPQITGGDAADLSTTLLSPEPFQYQKQVGDSRRVLHALRSLLEEFRLELREEEQRRCQLQQTYANERAAWEVQRAEMRSLTTQLEEARGEAQAAGGGADPMQEEREEQRRLLAESHSASLELRWKLQHSEKRWSRERTEMLERFERERRDWEWSMRDMHRKMEKMQRELANRHGEGAAQVEEKEGGLQHVFSPQDSPSKPPRSPRSPRPPCTPPGRSHSDSEATVEERGAAGRPRPTESLFLDALSLDPLSEVEVPPPSRLESEKRFPCMKEALNEISERGDAAAYAEEDMCSGSLLRAKSVCSMSDFQRLMDSSPFLPDKNKQGESGPDEATPPLSPDDLKYIEEFKSASPLPPCPIPGPALSLEAWADRTEGRRADPTSEAFQTAAWFLTTSATLTTNTLSSPEHCRRPSLRSAGSSAGPDHLGVHVLHSPTRTSAAGDRPGPAALEQETGFSTKARGGEAGGGEEVFGGRWGARDLRGGIRPGERPVCAVASYASALELELSRNLSDDMKEVAVRNAIRSGSSPPERQLRDTACQTNGFTTRGTQTTQTISVGLQTEGLRALTSSPHRCHTPKAGGSTPISSPSRSLRKMQYSPVVQSKFERPCCSPKYGSPKLQRKPSNAGKTEPPAAPPARAPTPTTPQKGNSESAWARSTTTRDSPVHTTINDGLSSLFNIIDHTPLAHEAMQKYNKSPSRSRPAEAAGPAGATDPKPPGLGGAHEGLLRNSRGRSPSPVQLIVETQGERTPEVSVRQDLSAPPGYTLAENAARILNKKLLEQSFREERRLPTATLPAAQGRGADAEKPVCIEDLPRSPVAPPLDSRFLRPARPAKRRPPSRWAAHSPSSSPSHKDQRERKFRFPSPMRPAQTIPELEEPGQEPWQPSA